MTIKVISVGRTGLTGKDGTTITVNEIAAVDGNITITASDVGADESGAAAQAAAQALEDANEYTDQSIAEIKYQRLEKTGTTYTLEAVNVTALSTIIIELSNDSFTEMYLPTPESLNVVGNMGFNVVITGDYNGQTLAVAEESGATLLGSPAFTETNQCKTVIAWSSSAWRIFG